MYDEEDEDENCDDETCEECGGEITPSRMTVRRLIAHLMATVEDIDAEIVVSLHSGDNTISLELFNVVDLDEPEDPTVLFITGLPSAWKTETGEDCGAGVIMLEDFDFSVLDGNDD